MPKITFLLILFFNCFVFCGAAQNSIQFIGNGGLGSNHETFESNKGKSTFREFGFGVKYKLFQFSYTNQYSFHSLGQDTQLPYYLERTAIESQSLEFGGINTINHSSRLRSNSLNLTVIDPFRKNAYASVGYGFHRAPKHWVYSERGGLPSKVLIPKDRFNSLVAKLGYSFNKFQFEFTHLTNYDAVLPRSGLSATYQYTFFEKNRKSDIEAKAIVENKTEIPKKEDDFYSIFRAEVGYSHWQPIAPYHNAGAISLDLALQVVLKRHLYIGGNVILGSGATGINLDTKLSSTRRVFSVDTSVNSFANARGASIYLGYDFTKSYPKSYFLTLGYGHYWLDQIQYDPNFNPWKDPYFRALQAQIGLKAGLFSNAIRLYIPTAKVRPFVEFRMSVGMDFFRLE